MTLLIATAGGRAIAQDSSSEVDFDLDYDDFVHVTIVDEEGASDVTSAISDIWWKYIWLCEEEERVWISDAPDRYTTSDLLAIKSMILMELVSLLGFGDFVNIPCVLELVKGMDAAIKAELLDYVNEQMDLNPMDFDLQGKLADLKAKIVALGEEEEWVWMSDAPDRFTRSFVMELKVCILMELLELRQNDFVGVVGVDWMIKAVESQIKAESMFYIEELPYVIIVPDVVEVE
jgi:hypothetical protein